MNEAGIKFHCRWIRSEPLADRYIEELNNWRDKLYALRLIGVYTNGIGYGNISIRREGKQFIISGTDTGKYEKLDARHYTLVTEYDLAQNTLTTVGPVKASSESLTHAVLYDHSKDINAVIHVHHLGLWKKLLNNVPTTNDVAYGTPAMANEVIRLLQESDFPRQKIMVMAGHREGVVTFGNDLTEAGERIVHELAAFEREVERMKKR